VGGALGPDWIATERRKSGRKAPPTAERRGAPLIAGFAPLVAKFSRSIAENHPFAPMLMRRPIAILCALSLVGFGLLAASSKAPAVSSAPTEARQFDFWLGEWTFASADGRLQGSSKVELVADGYGLLEQRLGETTEGNVSGFSLNAWNAEKKQWQQFGIGERGTLLELAGGLDAGGRMVLQGEQHADGERTLNRITWALGAVGTVRQHWEQSRDGGRTWATVFDGMYARKVAKLGGGAGGGHSRAMYYMFL
jgi:hypothetical protein